MNNSDLATALRKLATSDNRSETARLRDIVGDVEAALAAGVSRSAILDALNSQGFTMTLKSFESALYRIRKTRSNSTGEPPMSNENWIAHAYPLQQVTIKLQGTRHSDKAAIVAQLETVLARLKAGDTSGQDHDDDFGYAFEYVQAVPGPSFFDEPAGSA